MRFLINSVLTAKPKLNNKRAGLFSSPLSGSSPSVPTTALVTSSDSAIAVKKKWGQQCGVSCGCVVRFVIDLDDRDRVISAEYTAQRIIMTTATSRKDQQGQKNSNSSKRLQPLLTNRTGKLQYLPSNCKALHQLSACAISYFVNRPLWQIMNYNEFQYSRSSTAFRQTVLKAQNLTQTDSASEEIRPPRARLNKEIQQPKSHNHCFDLVEDAITALLKGYVPPPREPVHRVSKSQFSVTPYPSDISEASNNSLYFYNEEHFLYNDEAHRKKDEVSCASIPWQERTLNSSLFEIPRLMSWRYGGDDDRDGDHTLEYSASSHKGSNQSFLAYNSGKSSIRWTALDWMDWFESNREKQQQQIQMREEEASRESVSRRNGALSSLSHATDWLTYVDSIQLDETKSEQSA